MLKALEVSDIAALMADLGCRARAASQILAIAAPEAKREALLAAARFVRDGAAVILEANEIDVANAQDAGL
ncbi:MAG TPA: gamma-glutamyl-phosphate reductase, partial [Tianweitania sediminis]|nr:gamma-glutamyl-phosphate reductase [Tianweitania sediminis]